ncbi:hypothetical protein TVAG_446110 [Trichomonas vaginalis G3]|uniref:Tetraspanin family protein n=2 Tax=Trichomonas vaginalis (strain ATCC PRA-98 / G3) TaxID=412133 RepID=A2FXS0_TRIV3|nr:hypothetical protein TVAGG3_1006210 [Trichomonas vaginalis G3]EAX90311.1 hypothetical protein TVAG_446110 [Trichomonas vaginalis G3]KAI5491149.1 hypothetical protein TVAGG3_1006210 [Trichomonas vaginalis G3]|eukprot:XP_001303241.1 hypothetical protein [Trichomonas vaginalis G3]
MAFKIQTLLFLSSMMTVLFLASALFLEYKYLKTSMLYLIFKGRYRYIFYSMISVMFFAVLLEFVIYLDPSKSRLIYYSAYTLVTLSEIGLMTYGIGFIKMDEKQLKDVWTNVTYQDQFSKIEKALRCCGYSNVLMSASGKCVYTTVCQEVFSNEESYRRTATIILVFSSILFQIYNYHAIYTISGPRKVKPSEFEDLIESAQ